MSTPRAWLDGYPLDASGPVGWTYSPGPDPHRRVFSLERGAAAQILARAEARESVLELDVAGYGVERIEQLTVLPGPAASDPSLDCVEVVDRRYIWPQRRVYGRFNVRRRTGERRRLAANLPLAVQPIADDVAFARWSLNGEARWSPADVLARVFRDLAPRFELRSLAVRSYPIEDLVLDDSGDGAVRRLLSYFGGLIDLYVEADGTVVIYDRADDSERDLVGLTGGAGGGSRVRGQVSAGSGAPPSVVGPQLWKLQDRSLDRGEGVAVAFSRLCELRFDGLDEPSGADLGERGNPPLHMEMVLPCPDLELQLTGRKVLQGALITFAEAIAAWNTLTWPTGRTLTMELIRKHCLFPQALFALFAPAKLDEEGIYAARIGALLGHFRTSYRIKPEWRDRLGELLARRAEMRDSENGIAAPAECYANWAIQLTRRGQEKEIEANPKNVAVFVNRYAVDATTNVHSSAIPDMRPAPAEVAIADQDQGWIRLRYALEQSLGHKQVVFSALKEGTIPGADPSQPILFASLARLSDEHQVSVVISTVAVAPNDYRALRWERVKPEEVEALLGIKLGPCRGEGASLRVQPANLRAVARHAWDDERADEIRNAFRFQADAQGDAGADAGDPTLAFGDPLNPQELRALALAQACRYYLQRRDHVEGTLTTAWWPGVRPTGNAGPVSYTIDTEGRALTTVQFRRLELSEDAWAFLPDHVRQVVLGEVIP